MDLLKRIDEVKAAYDLLAKSKDEKINAIQKAEEEVASIDGNLKKLEGAFNTLVSLAQEEGLLDANGNLIKKEDESNGNNTEGDSSNSQEG